MKTLIIQIHHVRSNVFSMEIGVKFFQFGKQMQMINADFIHKDVLIIIMILIMILILLHQIRFFLRTQKVFARIRMFSTPIKASEILVAKSLPKKVVLPTSIANLIPL